MNEPHRTSHSTLSKDYQLPQLSFCHVNVRELPALRTLVLSHRTIPPTTPTNSQKKPQVTGQILTPETISEEERPSAGFLFDVINPPAVSFRWSHPNRHGYSVDCLGCGSLDSGLAFVCDSVPRMRLGSKWCSFAGFCCSGLSEFGGFDI